MITSSTLFHFTPKLDNVLSIIKQKGFKPSYCIEKFGGGLEFFKRFLSSEFQIKNEKLIEIEDDIAFPLVSFCDLRLTLCKFHTEKYGKNAIGMNPLWGRKMKITPIIYVDDNFITKIFFDTVLMNLTLYHNTGENSTDKDLSEKFLYLIDALKDSIQSISYIIKPYSGVHFNKKEKRFSNKSRNFYSEREWRYVPLVLFQEEGDKFIFKLKEFLVKLKENNLPELPLLEFEINEIEYILLEKKDYINKFFAEIDKMDTLKREDKLFLASKIICHDQLEQDF